MKIYTNPTMLDCLRICADLPQNERDQVEAFRGAPYDVDRLAAECFFMPDPKWVFKTDDGVPLCAGGFVLQRPGVWREWMINTNLGWAQYGFPITRNVVKVFNAMFKSGSAHRIECVSLDSRVQAHAWCSILGLHNEGVMRGFGANGSDAIMFARVEKSGHV